jgi:ribosome-binding factor A
MFSVLQSSPVSPGLITVTNIKCGKDLRDATVMVSVFGEESVKNQALRILKRDARFFQQAINNQVKMKFTPRLTFKLDSSLERGDEVLALLDKLPPVGE